jgi:hypothetical protein
VRHRRAALAPCAGATEERSVVITVLAALRGLAPNMRLKLAGAVVLKEAIMSCPGGHGGSSTSLAQTGRSPAA